MTENWDGIVFEHELADAYMLGLEDMLDMLFRFSRKTSDRSILTEDVRRAARAGRYTETPVSMLEAFVAYTDIAAIETRRDMDAAFKAFSIRLKTMEVESTMDALIVQKGYRPRETRRFISDCLRRGKVTNGPGLHGILPPMSPFNPAYFPRKAEAFEIVNDLVGQFAKVSQLEHGIAR